MRRSILLAALFMANLAGCQGNGVPPVGAATATSGGMAAGAGFVSARGMQLYVNGQPWRMIGANRYNLNSQGQCGTAMSDQDVDTMLADVTTQFQATVVRTWFFQSEAVRQGRWDWSAFDRTLAAAQVHHVRLIATLATQWGFCGDHGYKTERWYGSGYRHVEAGYLVSYRDWVTTFARRYANNPNIAIVQLMNEAEDRSVQGGRCLPTAPVTLRAWAADMLAVARNADPNHLLSIGTVGIGKCGTSGAAYQALYTLPQASLLEAHDYYLPLGYGGWLQADVAVAQTLHKPIFVGEAGIEAGPSSQCTTLAQRAQLEAGVLQDFLNDGGAGYLIWQWEHPPSLGCTLDVGLGDPLIAVLRAAK